MKRFILGSLVLVICLAGGIAQAGHIGLPVKFSQMPDVTQASHVSEHPMIANSKIVADAWQCTDPRSVTAVRWWGVYYQNDPNPSQTGPTGQTPWFELSFHNDVVLSPGVFEPGSLIGGLRMVQAQEDWTGLTNVNGRKIYEYNVDLRVQGGPLVSQVPTNWYWFDVAYDTFGNNTGINTWAWQFDGGGDNYTYNHGPGRFSDCLLGGGHWGPWTTPEGGDVCHDMAFEIMVPVPAAVILGILGLGVAGIKLRKYA